MPSMLRQEIETKGSIWESFPFVVLIVLLSVSVPRLTVARNTEPLPVESALKTRSFAQLMAVQFSPDAQWLAYTVQDNQRIRSVGLGAYAETGVPPWALGTDIYLVNLKSNETRNLTQGQGDNWLPVWSPDARYLSFLSDRGGHKRARLWVWDRLRNVLRRVSAVDVRSDEISWMPDSRAIIVETLPAGLSASDYARLLTSPAGIRRHSNSNSREPNVLLYRAGAAGTQDQNGAASDPWNLNIHLKDLSTVDLESGKVAFIDHGDRIAGWHLSPDGLHLAYTIPTRFEKPGAQQILFDLVTIALRTRQKQVLARDLYLDFDGAAFSWSPDGSKLAWQSGGTEESNYDCYVLDIAGKTLRNVSSLPPAQFRRKSEAPLWNAEGSHLYYLSEGILWQSLATGAKAERIAQIPQHRIIQIIPRSNGAVWNPDKTNTTIVLAHDVVGKQDGFYRVDLRTGASVRLLESGECYTCSNLRGGQFAMASGNGQSVAYFQEDAEHDSDLWMNNAQFNNDTRLTHLNPQFEDFKMGSARLIHWLSDDGETLHGALLLPSDYRKGKRYPLVVWVYGGAMLSDHLDHFALGYGGSFNLQLLATRGFAVFLPDAPLHLGVPMLDLVKTVLPGVNEVIEMGVADPHQLGIMGHSFGGYSTLALIVQTNRFKAAMEVDGFADLIGGYGEMMKDGTAFQTSTAERGQGLMGGNPWEFRNRYIENSPIFYLDRVETPLLLVQGSEDTTVAPFLGDEVFVGMRRLGKEVEYAKYLGEDHYPGDWSYASQLELCNRMITWFETHLQKHSEHANQDSDN